MAKIHWSQMADELWDSDGCHPDRDDLVRAMQEFRDSGSVTGYWFCDVSEPGSGPDRDQYPDDWHDGGVRYSWDVGPGQDQVDFTGLPE